MPNVVMSRKRKSVISGGRKLRRRTDSSNITRNNSFKVYQSLSNSGNLRVVKKVTSGSGSSIGIIPLSGFVLGGLTTSPVLGIYATLTGFSVYNTSIGPASTVSYAWGFPNNYSQIFDQFRILGIKVKGYVSNNSSSFNNTSTNSPLFYSSIDYDGGFVTPPTTVSAVLAYENSRIHQQGSDTGKPAIYRSFQPRIVNNLTNNIVSSNSYGLMPAKSWVDTNSPNCAHWGMFLAYDGQSSALNTIEATLTLVMELEYEFRGIRY